MEDPGRSLIAIVLRTDVFIHINHRSALYATYCRAAGKRLRIRDKVKLAGAGGEQL